MQEEIRFPLKMEFSVNIENMNFKMIIERMAGNNSGKSILSETFHIHSHIELFVCTEGEIVINTPDGRIKLCMGDAAIIPPNYPHTRLIGENDNNCKWCCISFVCVKRQVRDSRDIFSVFEKIFCEHMVVKIWDRIDFCREIADIVNKATAGESMFPALRVVAAISGILSDNCTMSVEAVQTQTDTHSVDIDLGLLYKLNHIINSCFMNELTNAQIAEMLFISERQLSRIAAKYYGMSIRHAIIDRRLTIAEKLLSETDNTVESIGASVGYDSKSGFYRDFRKKYGVTPMEYRMTGNRNSVNGKEDTREYLL